MTEHELLERLQLLEDAVFEMTETMYGKNIRLFPDAVEEFREAYEDRAPAQEKGGEGG